MTAREACDLGDSALGRTVTVTGTLRAVFVVRDRVHLELEVDADAAVDVEPEIKSERPARGK